MNSNFDKCGVETRFSKTNRPKNPGRKPSRLKKYLKDNNLGSTDLAIIFKQLAEKSKDELKKIINNPKEPILMAGAAAALLKDMVKGNTSALQWVVDRSYGKAKEHIELDGNLNITQMSLEERQARIDELLSKRQEAQEKNDI